MQRATLLYHSFTLTHGLTLYLCAVVLVRGGVPHAQGCARSSTHGGREEPCIALESDVGALTGAGVVPNCPIHWEQGVTTVSCNSGQIHDHTDIFSQLLSFLFLYNYAKILQ